MGARLRTPAGGRAPGSGVRQRPRAPAVQLGPDGARRRGRRRDPRVRRRPRARAAVVGPRVRAVADRAARRDRRRARGDAGHGAHAGPARRARGATARGRHRRAGRPARAAPLRRAAGRGVRVRPRDRGPARPGTGARGRRPHELGRLRGRRAGGLREHPRARRRRRPLQRRRACVARPPRHRRGADRARALATARRRGLEHAILHASAAGLAIYERLGFETLSTVRAFVTPPA